MYSAPAPMPQTPAICSPFQLQFWIGIARHGLILESAPTSPAPMPPRALFGCRRRRAVLSMYEPLAQGMKNPKLKLSCVFPPSGEGNPVQTKLPALQAIAYRHLRAIKLYPGSVFSPRLSPSFRQIRSADAIYQHYMDLKAIFRKMK
jgi:hypothetical protein